MAHIDLGSDAPPGILGPLRFAPETAAPLLALAQTLLRGPSPLTPAERERIAAHVSKLNDCNFCHDSHAAAAHALEPAPKDTPKMDALLALAGKVQKGGLAVTADDVAKAKAAGATDRDVHDAVLVAAAFCMYNRYVDGLATTPAPAEMYPMMGQRLAAEGYGQR